MEARRRTPSVGKSEWRMLKRLQGRPASPVKPPDTNESLNEARDVILSKPSPLNRLTSSILDRIAAATAHTGSPDRDAAAIGRTLGKTGNPTLLDLGRRMLYQHERFCVSWPGENGETHTIQKGRSMLERPHLAHFATKLSLSLGGTGGDKLPTEATLAIAHVICYCSPLRTLHLHSECFDDNVEVRFCGRSHLRTKLTTAVGY